MRSSHLPLIGPSRAQTAVRALGALLLLFVGLDHYYEYAVDHYSVLPTIGTLFLLNFLAALVVAVFLLAPLERISRRFGPMALKLAAASGLAIAATSLAALLASEQTPLFGFMELNYRPAILVALSSEAAATACLGLLLAMMVRDRRPAPEPRPDAGIATRQAVTSPSRSARSTRTTRRSHESSRARDRSGTR
jgi:hypothetical protein